MSKFLKKLKQFGQKAVSFIINIVLIIFYFLLISPFAIFIKLFRDYLEIKTAPSWKKHAKISNIGEFLHNQ